MEKILSVIIPTYNMEMLLGRCLDSLIIDEGMEFLEVLIINDGSKDKSLSIAKSYEKKYPDTFIVVDKENGNYGSCINRGLKEATGKYVKILDADDYYNNNSLKDYIVLLRKNDVDIVFNDYTVVDENDKELYHLSFDLPESTKFNIKETLKNDEFPKVRMHSVAYRRNILKDMNYIQTEKISYTDQEWVFLPITRMNTALYFNKVLYCYLYGRQGQSMSKDKISKNIAQLEQVVYSLTEKYEESIKSCDGFAKSYMSAKLSDQFRTVFNMYLCNSVLSDERLIKFDNRIKEISETAYEIPEKITVNHGFHYVKYLREHNFNTGLVRIHLSVNRKINTFKRFFSKQDIY